MELFWCLHVVGVVLQWQCSSGFAVALWWSHCSGILSSVVHCSGAAMSFQGYCCIGIVGGCIPEAIVLFFCGGGIEAVVTVLWWWD